MKTFQKKFVALTAVAGLAVLGAACEAEGGDVESPGVTEPADEGDTTLEGDTTVEGDTELEVEPTATETATE
ncbi:MAG: hypothetical protein KY461_08985 [Actinobacteria bacterium]|nr:hypothetical protein [Actinomycetota bacterium]